MSKWLYDPETDTRNGKQFKYDLPIHENDSLLLGFTYREIMDEVIANYGHDITRKEVRKQVKEHLEMARENMEELLFLCMDNMVKEIQEEK